MADQTPQDSFVVDMKYIMKEVADSIKHAGGAMPTGLRDTLTMILNTQDAELDDFAKNLKNNQSELNKFLEGIADDIKAGMDATAKHNADTQKDTQKQMEMTFKDMLDHQVSLNEDMFSKIAGSFKYKEDGDFSSQTILSITDTLNSEMIKLFDGQTLSQLQSEEFVMAAMDKIIKDIDKDRKKNFKTTDDGLRGMFKSLTSTFTNFQEKFSKFLQSGVGRSIVDTLNIITAGQLGVISSVWDNLGRMKGAIQEVYGGISKQVDTVFADQKEMIVDPAIDAVSGVGRAVGMDVFKTDDDKKMDLAEESNNILKDILKIQQDQLDMSEEERLRQGREKKESIVAYIKELVAKTLFIVGAVIGGVVGAIVIPFMILGKAVNGVIKLFTGLTITGAKVLSIFQKIPLVGSFIGKIVESFNKARAWLMTFPRVVGFFKSVATILSPLIKGLAFGFKFLGWPLQILMSVINFFRGFIGSSETTFLGKLKDGIKEMVVKFFEIPLRVLGWIWDKILGFMGIESKGTGDKLVKFLGDAIDKMFGPIVIIFTRLWETVKTLVSNIWKTVTGIVGAILLPLKAIYQLFTGDYEGLVQTAKDWFGSVVKIIEGIIGIVWGVLAYPFQVLIDIIKDLWPKIEKMAEGTVLEPVVRLLGMIGDVISWVMKWVKMKLKDIPIIGSLFKEEADDIEFANDRDREQIQKSNDRLAEIREKRAKVESGNSWGKSGKLARFDEEEAVLLAEIASAEASLESRSKKPIEVIESPDTTPAPEKSGIFENLSAQYSDLSGSGRKDVRPINERPSNMMANIGAQYDDLSGRKENPSILVAEVAATTSKVYEDVVGWDDGSDENLQKIADSGKDKKPGDKWQYTSDGIVYNMIKKEDGSISKSFSHIAGKERPSTIGYVDPVASNTMADTVYDVDSSKQTFSKKQLDQSSKMERVISSAMKEINNNMSAERPIVIQGSPEGGNQFDPREDIESMSILWLNKSWGLG